MPARAPFEFGAATESRRATSLKRAKTVLRKVETLAEKTARAKAIVAGLATLYADVECPLTHHNNFELLIAVILSARCTDAAVNKVTPALFNRYPNAAALAQASVADIESCIRTLGLFRAKAKSLKRCAQQLVDEFNGVVPSSMEELTRLAGVGRKTANVIRGQAFAIPGIAVDTHCKRLSRRLGLTREENPVKIEKDLAQIVAPADWTNFSHWLIIHGRRVCFARKPACAACPLSEHCPSKA